ncbi:prepilin-type N-terminal cleavage/methylation domain-containing protein [Modicisalibacter tunisiensis]|uniref:PilW family protein n=1 Tax=Modicisalibacter tunisiensis TaxID=390637 RepID=UPI001CCCEA16|nr:prepilin-type N-terminal cleavage/methylation domain-containing protein [Modicisalibacter tunisiensis]MBZ9540019.1 prepilin-type N-terminal cleavage/methylation domain-containing protein [Modicisalibacter tunisiensis]
MKRQTGLGLVELMVALLIGSLILLGAGEVFQLVRGQFERISQLSRRQADLGFFADRVLGDIRRADSIDVSGTDPLALSIDGEPVDYRVDADTEQLLRNGEVMFGGLADKAGAFDVDDACNEGDDTCSKNVVYSVTLNLVPGRAGDKDHSSFTFRVTNRAAAIKAAQENGNSQGGSSGSSGGNGSICQGPPWGKGGKPKECK